MKVWKALFNKEPAGMIALILVIVVIAWALLIRTPSLTRDDVGVVIADAISSAGIKSSAAVQHDVFDKFKQCQPIQVAKEPRERSCDDLCGRNVCVLAGARFTLPAQPNDTLYQPIACATKTAEAMFCHCCGS